MDPELGFGLDGLGKKLRSSIYGYKAGASFGRPQECVLYGDLDQMSGKTIERRWVVATHIFFCVEMAAITFKSHRLHLGERSL